MQIQPLLKKLFSRFILSEEEKVAVIKAIGIVGVLFAVCLLFGGGAILVLILLSL